MLPKAEQALQQINVMQADFTFQNLAQFNTGRIFSRPAWRQDADGIRCAAEPPHYREWRAR